MICAGRVILVRKFISVFELTSILVCQNFKNPGGKHAGLQNGLPSGFRYKNGSKCICNMESKISLTSQTKFLSLMH